MSTTATYPAGTSITNCFVVNSIADPTQFSYLRILHREPITASDGSVSYVLVDRTVLTGTYAPSFSTRTICAQTTSLSPFVFARVLDGTPPVISSASLSSNPVPLSTATTLSVGASDAQSGGSAISKVEYSLDNGSTWTLIPGSYYRTPSVAVSTGLTLPVGVYGV